VNAALRDRQTTPDTAEDIEDLSRRYLKRQMSDAWMELSGQAERTGEVVFTEFQLYDEE